VGDTKQQGRMYYPLPFSFHQTQGYYRFVVRLQHHSPTPKKGEVAFGGWLVGWLLGWLGKNNAREVGAACWLS